MICERYKHEPHDILLTSIVVSDVGEMISPAVVCLSD